MTTRFVSIAFALAGCLAGRAKDPIHQHDHAHHHLDHTHDAGVTHLNARSRSHDAALTGTNFTAGSSNVIPAVTAMSPLPPAPDGVTDLKFADFFKRPVGPRGLEYTENLKQLDGQRVRLLGHMVRQCDPLPGMFLLSPQPVQLHEHEYGPADELPACAVHVFTSVETNKPLPFTPGLLLLTGRLSVGPRDEADGRRSTARLQLDSPVASPLPNAPSGGAAKISAPAAPSVPARP
jgi:hypothetical protein